MMAPITSLLHRVSELNERKIICPVSALIIIDLRRMTIMWLKICTKNPSMSTKRSTNLRLIRNWSRRRTCRFYIASRRKKR